MTDHQIRLAAFAFLEEQTALHDDIVPWSVLREGFDFRGQRVPLVSPQGIFKPALLDTPLTFRTTAPEPGEPAPYHDELGPDGLLHYRYRGTDPSHRHNLGMKRAAEREAPLIYLFGIVPGEYLPIWPVHVVGFDDDALTFKVAVEDERLLTEEVADFEEDLKRAYVARVVVQRLHQQSFRRRVLRVVLSAAVPLEICRPPGGVCVSAEERTFSPAPRAKSPREGWAAPGKWELPRAA